LSFCSQTKTLQNDEVHAPLQSTILLTSSLPFGCFLVADTVSLWDVLIVYCGMLSKAARRRQKGDFWTSFKIELEPLNTTKKLNEKCDEIQIR
jgi:hypothetical protein